MPSKRGRERTKVEIAVVITTVLDSLDATVADLSPRGAMVVGASLPLGSQLQLDLDGHSVFATVMWSEDERMGLRFPFELHEGPLYQALEAALTSQRRPIIPRPAQLRPRAAAPAPVVAGFGRRVA